MLLDAKNHWAGRARPAEARCATLSAAGQVLSEHVDKHECDVSCTHAGVDDVETQRRDKEGWVDAYGLLKARDGARYPQRRPHEFQPDENGRCRWIHLHDSVVCGYPEHQHRYPCSPTCTHDDARTPGHPERVRGLSTAFGAMVGAASEVLRADPSLSVTEAACYEQGAEAMRAACLSAAMRWAESERGLSVSQVEQLRATIESATP